MALSTMRPGKKARVAKRQVAFVHNEFDLAEYVRRTLDKAGWEVDVGVVPMAVHSHCAGADAPIFALRALGIPFEETLASENSLAPAVFHLLHHRARHLISDVAFAASAEQCGPCFKHHGRWCNFAGPSPTALVASFVCTPYSSRNPRRMDPEYKPMVAPGERASTDTFHNCRGSIVRVKPQFFALENVDGVTASRGDCIPPIQYMLDDPECGLRTIGSAKYTVEVVSGVMATSAGLPQDRPRTLIFGARDDTGVNASELVKTFNELLKAAGPNVHHISTFLQKTSAAPAVATESPNHTDPSFIEYCQELKRAMDVAVATEMLPNGAGLPAHSERPSCTLRGTPRMKATLDIVHLLLGDAKTKFLEHGGIEADFFPIVDLSQSITRKSFKVDGSVPTLTTTSVLFSTTLGKIIEYEDLLASMGYPRNANISYMTTTAKRSLVGNSFAVPLSAFTIAAIAVHTKHLVQKKAPIF
jgi:site-specific DNA-cytosine methylase